MIPVIFACALSLDGHTTRHGESHIHPWTSTEDQRYFNQLITTHSVIIMGRKTYEAVQHRLRLDNAHQRYVVTSTPEKFITKTIPSQLEFTNEDPQLLLRRLEEQGHTKALLVGGAALGKTFLEARCVTEIWVTLEPKIFGSGDRFVTQSILDISLELLEMNRWNQRGTLFLRYRVCTT